MNRHRLTRLIFLMENLTTELPQLTRFDMGKWFDKKSKGGVSLCPIITECGTAACALGAACLWPEFQEQGLKLHSFNNGIANSPGAVPTFNNEYAGNAGELFFDLSAGDTDSIFYSGEYSHRPITPRDVAQKIKNLLSKGKE